MIKFPTPLFFFVFVFQVAIDVHTFAGQFRLSKGL